MRADAGKAPAKRAAAKTGDDVTTMRIRRSTLRTLTQRQQDLGAASLDEALATILFRQHSYEAIARLNADPAGLGDYQTEAREWAEVDVEVRE